MPTVIMIGIVLIVGFIIRFYEKWKELKDKMVDEDRKTSKKSSRTQEEENKI